METTKQNKRKENAQRAKDLVSNAVETLAARLEEGHSDELKKHLASVAQFHSYSWGNVALIISQRPDATQVAGFNAWRKLGRQVKKGEKGIMIRAPYTFRKDDAGGDDTDVMCGFKAAYVFDVSQTEGDELPGIAEIKGDPSAHIERLREYALLDGITLEYREDIPVLGSSAGGKITIRKGLPPAEEFSTLAHEIGHEKLHHSGERLSKTVKETEAEAVAFVVCSAIGLDANQAAADYIGLYRGDAKTLRDSLERVSTTAKKILVFLHEEPARKAA